MSEALRFLKKKGISKGAVSEQIGIHQSYLSHMLKGIKPFTESFIKTFKKEYAYILPIEALNKIDISMSQKNKTEIVASNLLTLRIEAIMKHEDFLKAMVYDDVDELTQCETGDFGNSIDIYIENAKIYMKNSKRYSQAQINNFESEYLDSTKRDLEKAKKEINKLSEIVKKAETDTKKTFNVDSDGDSIELNQAAEEFKPIKKNK